VTITTPPNVADSLINKFAASKSSWILGKLDEYKNILVKSPAESKKEYAEYKNKALEIAKDRIAFFNRLYKFKHGNISIKNHKSLWGSCSRQGNLNFNYRIALVPQRFSDYVIVHELCHLQQFNHSQKFWDLVALTIPAHKEIRRELKKLGLRIG
jgi:predicted metal-dependent hydrolase